MTTTNEGVPVVDPEEDGYELEGCGLPPVGSYRFLIFAIDCTDGKGSILSSNPLF